MDGGERRGPRTESLTRGEEDKGRKILDLLERRASGRGGQTQRDTDKDGEGRDDVVLSVFPRGDSAAC